MATPTRKIAPTPADAPADPLAALFRAHGAMVYRRARRILGNTADAEEAVQDVFVRAFTCRQDLSAVDSHVAWLYRITTNHCLNRVRDAARRRELLREHGAAVREEPTADGPSPGDLVLVRRLLTSAPAEDAAAAVYVFVDGMSYSEAAPLLGVSKRTVGNRIERFVAYARAHSGIPAALERGEA